LLAGEEDIVLVEQRVQERLDVLRRYQISHPEQATEGMNLLAQAFVCLTDPIAKRDYDQKLQVGKPSLAPPPVRRPPVAGPSPPPVPNAPGPRDPLVWLYTPGMNGPGELPPPPPVRVAPITIEVAEEVETAEPTPPSPPPPAPTEVPIDPILEAAQQSVQARRGLATRRALYRRVGLTRHLQRLWHRLGKYLNDTEKRLSRPEASELYKLVEQIEEACFDFPLLGEAGQPGHLILSLTQLDRSKALLTLSQGQRESLQRDWEAGLRFLEAHRDYLRVEIAASRGRSRWVECVRAIRSWLNEKPLAGVLVLLALLALSIAVWRSFLLTISE
jgi:hypothetical protein